MPASKQKSVNTNGAATETPIRRELLGAVGMLDVPTLKSFQNGNLPETGDLQNYRIVPDAKVRQRLVAAGLLEIVQRPGPGNWTKVKPIYIGRVYPNFNAPGAGSTSHTREPRGPRKARSADLLPAAIVHDLRQKWEAYFIDTRPAQQRRHEQLAQSVSPETIAKRASELIADARKERRPITSRAAMLQATDEMTTDFETALRKKYGDLVVEILGIPDSTDRGEKG